MKQSDNTVTTMQQASALVMAQPQQRVITLGSGQSLTITRLSWISFELLWQELCVLLAAWPQDAQLDDAALVGQLSQAPQFVLKLAALSSGIAEDELARWDHDAVLQLAAAALQFNFTQPAGLRDFFGGLATLWQAAQGPQHVEQAVDSPRSN
jgi:hypothetical protein